MSASGAGPRGEVWAAYVALNRALLRALGGPRRLAAGLLVIVAVGLGA